MQNCPKCGKVNDNQHAYCSTCEGKSVGRSCAYTIVCEIRRETARAQHPQEAISRYKIKLANRWKAYYLKNTDIAKYAVFFNSFSRTVAGIVENWDYSSKGAQQQGNTGF